MAFENLFIRSQKTIGGIQLDAVLSESHNNSVSISNNPVELGANITDNAIIDPKRITMVVEVSDTPLSGAAFGAIVDLITGLFGSSTTDNLTRSNTAYNAMVQLMEAREPIEVQTKLVNYTDMLITNINATQDKDTSRIARMVIALEEIIIVESEVVQLEAKTLQSGTPRQQGSPAENKGRQEPIPVNENTNKSVLKSVIDWTVQ